jgi:hypothetical protein
MENNDEIIKINEELSKVKRKIYMRQYMKKYWKFKPEYRKSQKERIYRLRKKQKEENGKT